MNKNQSFWHLCMYSGSVAAGSSFASVAAINDGLLTRLTANSFTLPETGKVRFACSIGTDLQRVRLNTPSFRYVGLPVLAPINQGTTIPSPVNVYDPQEMGPSIPKADEISIEAVHSNVGAQTVTTALAFTFGNAQPQTPIGPTYRIRYTGTIAAVVGAWASGSITPDTTLPAGVYAICGMDVMGDDLVAGRLIFSNGGYRPGVVARQLIQNIPHPLFTSRELGVFGFFDSINTPNLEIFALAANATQEVYLDLIRVSDR